MFRARLGFVLALIAVPSRALAEELPSEMPPAVDASADDVSFDARQRELHFHGHVKVDSPPFYLTSDELDVRRTPFGAEVKGKGKVAFCPCLGTPLAVGS